MKTILQQLFVLFLVGLFISAPAAAQTEDIYSCVSDLIEEEKPKKPNTRAVVRSSKKWIPGQEIRVRFLEGSEFLRNKVMENAELWEEHANLDFVFVESGPAEIRISFTMDKGSWSFFGTDSAKQSYVKSGNGKTFVRNASGASMNFGWFNEKTSDEEFRRTTLHEFGHALGLAHEHQNANRTVEWNEEAVYAHFAKQGWPRERTFTQVLKRYGDDTEVSNGVYDPLSIMHYFYPPQLIKGGGQTRKNTTLSNLDKRIVGEIYPFDETATVVRPPTTNTNATKPAPKPVPGPVFAFSDVSVDFEGYDEKTEQEGMTFSSDFTVKNGLKQEFTIAIYFYHADGTPLEDSNQKFRSANGKVAAFRKFVPAYESAVYKQFQIFIPYDELEFEECGEHNLKYSVTIWRGQTRVSSIGYTFFELDVPCE